jgi:TRAP-type mannitol/chloroaromatic compound transport system substrate-binding protein
MPKQGEESSLIKKCNFYWRGKKEGVTLLESSPFGKKSTQTQVWVRWSDKDNF